MKAPAYDSMHQPICYAQRHAKTPSRAAAKVALVAWVSLALTGCLDMQEPSVELESSRGDDKSVRELLTPLGGSGLWLYQNDILLSEGEVTMLEQTARDGAGSLTGLKTYDGNWATWSAAQASNLTYCIAENFSADTRASVKAAFEAAALAWSAAANVSFVYQPQFDANCATYARAIPASNGGPTIAIISYYLSQELGKDAIAAGSLPLARGEHKLLLVDENQYDRSSAEDAQLAITHEVGHLLGFIHEFDHPNFPVETASAACLQVRGKGGFREMFATVAAINDYDPYSVMNYTFCGAPTKSGLSDGDKVGARLRYPSQ